MTIVSAGAVWDLYSKSSVFAQLGYPHGRTPWVRSYFGDAVTFDLYTSFNEGALWGVGQGYASVFALLSVIAGIAVLYWLFVHGAARSWWLTVALGCVMAGTLGNLYDRLGLHGYPHPDGSGPIRAVRDFLHFRFQLYDFRGGEYFYYDWPIFNFADVFLVTGAAMLVLQSFRSEMALGHTSDTDEDASTTTESASKPVAQEKVAAASQALPV